MLTLEIDVRQQPLLRIECVTAIRQLKTITHNQNKLAVRNLGLAFYIDIKFFQYFRHRRPFVAISILGDPEYIYITPFSRSIPINLNREKERGEVTTRCIKLELLCIMGNY